MLNVKRIKKKFQPDYSRIIIKPHIPTGEDRIERIIMRVISLSEEKTKQVLDRVIASFSNRHKNIWDALDKNYNEIKKYIPQNTEISEDKKALLGAYFSLEYSIQAAAFFNPSIIPHPDQSNLPKGSLRFILSFRSVGEGHISSIEFRSGVVDENCEFTFDKVSRYAERAQVASNPVYDKTTFFLKLSEMQKPENIISQQVSDLLSDQFLLSDLIEALDIIIDSEHKDIGKNILWLAKSNY